MEQLRRELFARWDEQLLERYLNDYDANAEPRARLSLPWGATPNVLPASDRALVRWAVPRPVELKAEGGVVELCAHKRRWRFDEKALAVLGPLSARRVCSVAELCEGARATLDERTVRAFLRELIVQGLVVIVKE